MNHRIPAEFTETVRRFGVSTRVLQLRAGGAFQRHAERFELAAYPTIVDALGGAAVILRRHAAHLEEEILLLSPGGFEASADRAFITCHAGPQSAGGVWPATRILRDDLVSVAGLISSLTLLHSMALARSVESLAAVSARQLQDTTSLQLEFSVLLSGLVIAESTRREPIASMPDAVHRAKRQIRHAWSSLTA